MGDTFHCGDNAALVGYLYDEGDARERAEIAAHLAICSDCAAEVANLSATRQLLSVWTPPEAQLDFRLTSGAAAPPARWWSNPLPAWAQLAAAAVIFAFGLALGAAFTRTTAQGAMSSQATDVGISQAELTRLDERLRTIESKSAVPVALGDESRQLIATWVRQEIQESETRNRKILAQAVSKITGGDLQDVTGVGPSGYGPVPIGARFGSQRPRE